MEWLTQLFSEDEIYFLEVWIDDYFFYFAMALLLIELIVSAFKKRLNLKLLGDTATNFVTLAGFIAIGLLFIGFYLGTLYWFYQHLSFAQLPINGWTIGLAIIIADFIYYWEHRFMHRVGFAWANHSVHHSSPHFNISVAYRFGPMDSILPLAFHIPMAMLGFNPFLILFAEKMVQLYQTALHTELVKKLPAWFEAVMNTPSHHRVHHGSNPEYIDKNYAGIFIIWDKMFNTYRAEKAPVNYGITTPLNSVNPVKVFFFGFWQLLIQIVNAKRLSHALGYLFKPPGWQPTPQPHVKRNMNTSAINSEKEGI